MIVRTGIQCPFRLLARYPWEERPKRVMTDDVACRFFCPYYVGRKLEKILCKHPIKRRRKK